MKEFILGGIFGIWFLLCAIGTVDGVVSTVAIIYPIAVLLIGFNILLLKKVIMIKIRRKVKRNSI